MKYVLTLKCHTQMQQTTLQNVLNYFKEEVRLDISCELSVSLADSSLEILFSLKNNEKKIRMLSAAILPGDLMAKVHVYFLQV